ncbi:hypothetical protein K461DRAFT_281332 [Myriangium duriaei CBS 260.36]|uniref:RING-type E3 ubiquitin transferase n=1 Tax=Myriangium duriaei CBS 260.36 TaxID=1168546 RepID=A0A9P4MJS0_9PEZI|nr:hypothetical protein K461DRAFT_281332 [Myriangium duriaei CBS 260.36]
MRPTRLVLAIATCILTVLLLSYIATSRSAQVAQSASGRLHALFDWRSPSSLFPPSAIISLTDDNSTFFLARPANFGPLLPSDGLSGQLWIGSGFGEDAFSRSGVASAEGELGCSDVPGWDPGDRGSSSMRNGDIADKISKTKSDNSNKPQERKSSRRKRSIESQPNANKPSNPTEQDGTDDHLHHPLPSSEDPKAKAANGKKPGHADIQSIQESAEIAGKVVLLRRGGCGFLEKVKWVQRRGGTALIVGDNERGGALVTMYARGDTSNVTIPSLFTSYTTAQLLSSLMPSGGRRDDISIGDAKRLGLALGQDSQLQTDSSFTTPKGTSSKAKSPSAGKVGEPTKSKEPRGSSGWFSSLFKGTTISTDGSKKLNEQPQPGSKTARPSKQTPRKGKNAAADDFVIGVHDWRDPDLFEFGKPLEDKSGSSVEAGTKPKVDQTGAKSGSNTPGSGKYKGHAVITPKQSSSAQKGQKPSADRATNPTQSETSLGSGAQDERPKDKPISRPSTSAADVLRPQVAREGINKPHEGLWVTLQPTTMSTSPFFDTLLVLVVSPLVTLTVVYALLLLRSRIRRRRWRAPKSVVERLPVRTYHTIASSTATTSSAQVSPPSTPRTPDQTTPLLHSSARPIGQRPRSRTTGEVPVASSSFANMNNANLSLDQIQEKREAGLMEWRRKYGGRQRECVVCLEEYVDGVSQVMSLPCGHEFHAECITPWLTTRRRTCPICKGDVVRSLARVGCMTGGGNANEQRYDSYDDDDDESLIDGVQRQAVTARNDDPEAAGPLEEGGNRLDDIERDAGRRHDRDRVL